MKVTNWTYWEDSRYEDLPNDLVPEANEVIIKELRDKGYKISGFYHQGGEFGVPVIDDTYKAGFSQRTWGHLMMRAYHEEIDNSDGYGYTEWAWNAPEEQVLPEGQT